jgi:hypothetical protein
MAVNENNTNNARWFEWKCTNNDENKNTSRATYTLLMISNNTCCTKRNKVKDVSEKHCEMTGKCSCSCMYQHEVNRIGEHK